MFIRLEHKRRKRRLDQVGQYRLAVQHYSEVYLNPLGFGRLEVIVLVLRRPRSYILSLNVAEESSTVSMRRDLLHVAMLSIYADQEVKKTVR